VKTPYSRENTLIRSRFVAAGAVTAALLSGAVLVPASAAPDPEAPTGTFAFTATTRYLHDYRSDVQDPYAHFELRAVAISDDETAPENVVVKIDDGSGDAHPIVWGNTSVPLTVTYDDDGTYAPKAILSDQDHHTTVIDLPELTVLIDHTPPQVTFARPGKSMIHRMAGWRVLHGTVVDAGYGENGVYYQLMQRRHGRWYYFDDNSRWQPKGKLRWLRGRPTLAATKKLVDNFNANHDNPPNTWRTPRIPGLTRGPIVFCLQGVDGNLNETTKRCATGRITRR
jgi:hypothetical protein